MMLQAQSCPEYSIYVQTAEESPQEQQTREQSNSLVGAGHARRLTTEMWLTLIFLTCINLAAKVLETVPCQKLLTTMMSFIYQGEEVPFDAGAELEIEVIKALHWRLGPVFKINK